MFLKLSTSYLLTALLINFLLYEDNNYLIKLLESLSEVTYVKTCKMHGICILNFPNEFF